MPKTYRACALCFLIVTVLMFVPAAAAHDYPAGWEPAVLVETSDSTSIGNSDVAMDEDGNAVAVWRDLSGVYYNIWVNRYEVGLGWGDPVMVVEEGGQIGAPVVAVNDLGNAIVVWNQFDYDSSIMNLWMALYGAGQGWADPVLVEEDDSGHSWYPDVAADPSGSFFIIWCQSDGAHYNALCRMYDPGSGFGDTWVIDVGETEDVTFPKIGTDSTGCAVAVWKENASAPHSVVSSRYEPDTGWSAPVTVGGHVANGFPVLSVEPGGNATCAWQHMNVYYEIWGNHYTVGSGWGTPTVLRTYLSANVMEPDVASVGYGRSIVVCYEWGPGSMGGICAIGYDSSSGWDSGTMIASSQEELPYGPRIASSFQNDAIVVFTFGLPSQYTYIWAIPYNSDEGWGHQEEISTPDLGDANYPEIRMNRAGDAIALWEQFDGLRTNVWACNKAGPDTIPPALSIDNPSDGAVLDASVVTVEGTTETGVSLDINGIVVAVDHDGAFSLELTLSEGENEIIAVATDAAGNSASAEVTVTYDNPFDDVNTALSDLEDSLQEALDKLAALTPELNETRESLSDSQEELADADRRLDSLASQLTLLATLAAVASILAVLAVVMSVMQRKRIGGASGGLDEQETPPPPE